MRSSPFARIEKGRDSGFTLLELLVVLAIAGLFLLFIPQLTPSVRQGVRARAAAYQLADDLRMARGEAISTNRETRLEWDDQSHAYLIEPKHISRPLKPDVSIAFPIEANQMGHGEGAIGFFPDGSSTGGVVRVTASSGRHYTVIIHALSGRIVVDE